MFTASCLDPATFKQATAVTREGLCSMIFSHNNARTKPSRAEPSRVDCCCGFMTISKKLSLIWHLIVIHAANNASHPSNRELSGSKTSVSCQVALRRTRQRIRLTIGSTISGPEGLDLSPPSQENSHSHTYAIY